MLIFPYVSALEISDYSMSFDVKQDGTVHEEISMAFSEKLTSSELNYVVLGDISDLKVTDGERNIDYTLEKVGSEHSVKFVVPEGTENLEISFIAKDLVFSKDNVYSFSTSLEPPESDSIIIRAFLPKGFAIYREVIHPGGYDTLTDGERIYLEWDLSGEEDVMLSFKFYNTHNDYSVIILTVMSVIIVVVAGYLIFHYKGRVKKEFMRGFTEDERKVLSRLQQDNVIMQKKLEKEFSFSRAKMTRIVKRLEAKGLLEKERVGRTNRLFFKK